MSLLFSFLPHFEKEVNEEEAEKGMEIEVDFEGDMYEIPEDQHQDIKIRMIKKN